MRKFYLLALSLLLISAYSWSKSRVIYSNPVPDSRFHNPETGIIIRFDNLPSQNVILSSGFLTVSGSRTGIHPGTVYIGGENTVVFTPLIKFALGEKVFVECSFGDKYKFEFYIKEKIPSVVFSSFQSESGPYYQSNPGWIADPDTNLPGFPNITLNIYGPTAPGKLFLSNFRVFGQFSPFLIIKNNNNSTFFARQMAANCYDFKKQPNGKLTYANYQKNKFYMLDTNYVLIDSFTTGNGYTTDEHELQILPNGHALLMAYDPQIVNMELIVPGGDTAATVIGLIIQELDENKEVVFQWRSWDHFQITDALHENLTAHVIDYVHGNAIEPDLDGNLMISSRHLDEITKINRTTGNIIWRFGGLNNQFTRIGDPDGFNYQHSIRRVSQTNVILYDNGVHHSPQYSRAVEYTLDEVNKIATLVWQYRNSPDIVGIAMGSVQRLSNGNTLIGWGTTVPTMTEVTPDKTKVMQLSLPPAVYSYRSFRYEFRETLTGTEENAAETPESYRLDQNYPNPFNNSTKISFSIPKNGFVKLSVIDIAGREVAQIINNELEAGYHSHVWNAGSLSSGIYFVRLNTGSFSDIKKMVLIK